MLPLEMSLHPLTLSPLPLLLPHPLPLSRPLSRPLPRPFCLCVRHVALVVATDSLDASQSWVISSDHFAAYANPERASPLDTSRATVYNRITYSSAPLLPYPSLPFPLPVAWPTKVPVNTAIVLCIAV